MQPIPRENGPKSLIRRRHLRRQYFMNLLATGFDSELPEHHFLVDWLIGFVAIFVRDFARHWMFERRWKAGVRKSAIGEMIGDLCACRRSLADIHLHGHEAHCSLVPDCSLRRSGTRPPRHVLTPGSLKPRPTQNAGRPLSRGSAVFDAAPRSKFAPLFRRPSRCASLISGGRSGARLSWPPPRSPGVGRC